MFGPPQSHKKLTTFQQSWPAACIDLFLHFINSQKKLLDFPVLEKMLKLSNCCIHGIIHAHTTDANVNKIRPRI